MLHRSTQPGRKAQGTPLPITAPTRGMNTLANYEDLEANQARLLENFLPQSGSCDVRPGIATASTLGSADAGISLMEYHGADGTKLIASASDGTIYDASGGSATDIGDGFSSSPWSYCNLNGRLLMVNGQDAPQTYDGSTLANSGWNAGFALSELRTIKFVRNRAWFTRVNSPVVYYGPLQGIAGDLTAFDLGQIADGGKCVGVYEWQGQTLFIMSTGQLLIYAGDPSTDFSINTSPTGKFQMPPPVGYDPAVNLVADLVLLNSTGPVPMQLVAAGLAFVADSLQTWGQIQPSWADDFRLYGANAGWNAVYSGGLIYINIPTGNGTAKQWVNNLNVPGGAWTTYSGLNAGQFATTEAGLFFTDAAAGRVAQHSGAQDDGQPIIATSRQGFTYPTKGQRAVKCSNAKLLYQANGAATCQLQLDVDFRQDDFRSTEVQLSLSGGGGAWDEPWDSAWGFAAKTQQRWQSAKGYGTAIAPAVRIKSQADKFQWLGTEVMVSPASKKG